MPIDLPRNGLVAGTSVASGSRVYGTVAGLGFLNRVGALLDKTIALSTHGLKAGTKVALNASPKLSRTGSPSSQRTFFWGSFSSSSSRNRSPLSWRC